MKFLLSIATFTIILVGCTAFVILENALASQLWRKTASLHPEYTENLSIGPVDCISRHSHGNATCTGCIRNAIEENPDSSTVCVSVTSRLAVKEVFVEMFDMQGMTVMQEILTLTNSTFRAQRKNKKSLSCFGGANVRVFPTHVIEKIHGVTTTKFCVDAVFTVQGCGARWCYSFNGKKMVALGQSLLLGENLTYLAVDYDPSLALWENDDQAFLEGIFSK